jgi:small redox-active disulfide protein 2
MKKLQILGTGCPKCKKLAENAEAAAKDLGIEYSLEKVTQINEIMKFGVTMTPALAIDGQVKSIGKVVSPDEIKKRLNDVISSGGCAAAEVEKS